ncbi:PREDICTED: LOW QUALITY PROTEIN: peroxidase 19 [Brassica oleracea var. oleracea]|uniref:LOW QUALITY PROTEIN: peroxidase 19 n=1 Tax=Brassica oleracea var. oleracea TaxID=109376 RepID=UPI0006A6C2CC|nr:PREDICTED: LOW QUALITY PROTEIN: peroxidase 19 [Brassica oleracea var. oleracea]
MHVLSLTSSLIFRFLFLISTIPISSAKPITSHPQTLPRHRHRELSTDYYSKKCPQLESLVGSVTSQRFKEAPVSAPATIRLFFHDCFVEGCDGSILIETKKGSKKLAEREAEENKELREEGFVSIIKAKALVESHCPSRVSCSDILAIAARDFIHLAGGPYYQVKKGRWDGKRSTATNVPPNIPRSNSTVDQLIKLFASKGLTVEDLVEPDPNINPKLLKELRMYCPFSGRSSRAALPLDATTPFAFDNGYYRGLGSSMGLLGSDQALFLDPRTKPIVLEMARDKQKFLKAFGDAMDKMGSIGVKRGRKHGEIRKDCRVFL